MRSVHSISSQYVPHKDYDGDDLELRLVPRISYPDDSMIKGRKFIYVLREIDKMGQKPVIRALAGSSNKTALVSRATVNFNAMAKHRRPHISYSITTLDLI